MSIEAIHGTAQGALEREYDELDGSSALLRFALSHAAHDQAVQLVTANGPAQKVDSEDDSENDASQDEDAAVQPLRLTRGGRAVHAVDYTAKNYAK